MLLARCTWILPCIAIGATAVDARADSLRDATRVATIRPASGFVDTPLALDRSGKRLAYVTTNAADKSALHVFDLDDATEIKSFGIASLKATPVAVFFVGEQLFVVGSNRGREIGVVYDQDGGVARRTRAADRVRATSYKGRQVAALYSARKRGDTTVHDVEAIDLATGKRVGKRTRLTTNAAGVERRRRFIVNHWESEHLIAVGTAIGTYNRKADQRMPDEAGRFDLVAGEIAEREEIRDLIAHRHYLNAFTAHSNDERFVALSRDKRSLQLFDGRLLEPAAVTLAEPFLHYDPSSLESAQGSAGSVFFTLTIDPVHPEAAAARRAVPRWLDVYELPRGATRAIRRVRWLLEKKRTLRWVATSRHFIAVPAHVGFSRGGPELGVFRFEESRSPTTSKK